MWLIEIGLKFEPDRPADDLAPLVMATYRDLRIQHDVYFPDFNAQLGEGTVSFSMGVKDEGRADALNHASASLRCALHAAGAGTAGWEARMKDLIDDLLDRADVSAKLVGANA